MSSKKDLSSGKENHRPLARCHVPCARHYYVNDQRIGFRYNAQVMSALTVGCLMGYSVSRGKCLDGSSEISASLQGDTASGIVIIDASDRYAPQL